MPLKVAIGRANAGKTGWILRWALEALDSGDPPTLVVPSLSDVRRMQKEIADKASFGVRVVTPQTLAEELWQLHGDGRRFVGDAARAAVVRGLLTEPLNGRIGPSASTPGFKELLIRAARLCAHVHDADARASRDAGAQVVHLLAAYRAALADLDLIEPGWIPGLLAHAPPELGFVGFLRFTTFSAPQLELICSLAEKNTVSASLTWEEGFLPTRANDSIASALLTRADEIRVAEEAPSDQELDAIATGIRSGPASSSVTGSVVLGEAKGREAEAALVAAMVARAVSEGTPPERVAVVFGQIAPRLGLLRNAMAAESIACSFDCPLTFDTTPFGSALIALLRVALGRGGREDALQFLQGPFSDADGQAVIDLDRAWRRRRQTEDSVHILSDVIGMGGGAGQAASLCRRTANARLDDRSLVSWQELTDLLISNAASASREVRPQDASAHRAASSAIAEMASASGHPFDAADLLEALPSLSCALHSEEPGGRVQIIQAADVGARRFDEVIVAGLTQGEFPRTGKETFASEVRALATGRIAPADEAGADLEFYTLLTRPRRRLWLVRQTADSDGAIQAPSILLERALDIYRLPRRPGPERTPALPEVVRCDDSRAFAPVFTRGRRSERLLAEEAIPRRRMVVRGRVAESAAAELTKGRVFSATEIDAYLQCPYGWFYARVLRPREIDAQFDAAALGSRAHGLIADFYEVMAREGRDRVTPETLAECLDLFEMTALESEERRGRAQGLAEEIDAGRAHLWARHVVEDDAHLLPGYLPLGHEVEFGHESVFDLAGVSIAGRIDRIDVGPEGAVVTDYKSARDVGQLARQGDEPGIQHVLYALAAERLGSKPVVASVYRSLRSRRLRGFWRSDLLKAVPPEACEKDLIDEAGFSAMIESLEGRIARAVERMSAGEIGRTPHSASACRYCGITQLCKGALT